MTLSNDFDSTAFLKHIDKNAQLTGMRVVYFDGYRMQILREGPPDNVGVLRSIVIRPGFGDEAELHSAPAAENRDGKFFSELLGVGLSCSAAALSWTAVVGSTGAAPISGGSSTFITVLAYGAAVASSLQCGNSLVRIVSEVAMPEANDWLDTQDWYVKTSCAIDAISLAGGIAASAATIKMVLAVRNTTGKSLLEVLKGLSRQERKRLTEEAIRAQSPGASNTQIKALVRAGLYPKRYTGILISESIKIQLKDALGAAFSFTGSATTGIIRGYVVGISMSIETN